MTDTTLQEQARALGDPTRYAIFRHIAQAGRPIGIAELNEEFPLNHNAIRQHLAKLVAAQLVVGSLARGAGRGRPHFVYEVNVAFEGQWGTTGPYERLGRLLVEIIQTGLEPEEVGRRASGRFRVASSSGDAVVDIASAMARQGFEPEICAARGGTEIVLHHCPFVGVARLDRETVCSLHLGIAEGLAEATTVSVTELVAYDPRKAECRLRIRTRADDDASDNSGTLTLRARARAR
jgi:predicted ArsR family transcriptional regulator